MDRIRNLFREATRTTTHLITAVVVVLLAIGTISYGAFQLLSPSQRGVLPLPGVEYVQGEFLVKFQPGAAADGIRSLNAQNNVQQLEEIPGIAVARLKVPTGHSVNEMITLYGRNPNVVFAEPNYIRTATDTPNDPYLPDQWNLPKISAPAAWDVNKGSASVIIAVIDSGIALAHEDLVGRFSGTPAADDYGHGTEVASVIGAAAGNGKGIAGICRLCTLISYKVLDSTGSGSDSAVASAITSAADAGAKVINLSLGSTASSSTGQNAVTYAWNKGAVVIAAAGNAGNATPYYPAAYTNVISVGGSDGSDLRVPSSNYGSWVKIFAPGVDIPVATMAGSYDLAAGTSFASPEVAGVAGLLFSANPSLTNSQVVSLILGNTDSVSVGARLNAYKAVAAATGAQAASTPAPSPTSAPASASPSSSVAAAQASASPSPSPTPTPTPTPAPAATPTPVPTAATITQTFTGTVSKSGTSFKEHTITVSAAGTISASLGGWTGNLNNNNLDLYLFSGATQLAAATTANRPENLTFAVTTPGTYTLRVVAAAGTGTYTLTVTHP